MYLSQRGDGDYINVVGIPPEPSSDADSSESGKKNALIGSAAIKSLGLGLHNVCDLVR